MNQWTHLLFFFNLSLTNTARFVLRYKHLRKLYKPKAGIHLWDKQKNVKVQ